VWSPSILRVSPSPRLPVPVSPRLRVSVSPCLPVSPSPRLFSGVDITAINMQYLPTPETHQLVRGRHCGSYQSSGGITAALRERQRRNHHHGRASHKGYRPQHENNTGPHHAERQDPVSGWSDR